MPKLLLREQLQPVIDAFNRGDTEHAGMEVAATLVYFCRTGKVKLDWRDVQGPLLVFADTAD